MYSRGFRVRGQVGGGQEGIDKKKKERRIPSVGTFAPTLYPCLYRERKKERGRFIAILAYCRKPAVVLFSSLCLRNRFYRTFLCIQRIHRPSSFPLHLLRYMTFSFSFFLFSFFFNNRRILVICKLLRQLSIFFSLYIIQRRNFSHLQSIVSFIDCSFLRKRILFARTRNFGA